MKKETLNNYIGKRVRVYFTDGDVLGGTLNWGMLGRNDDKSWYNLPENNLSFRAYHVKKVMVKD